LEAPLSGDRFRDQSHTHGRGRVGEEDAAAWLATQGYEILERNVVNDAGEIDLVARDGPTLCFVEVKARDGDLYGPAIAAVGPAKQRRIGRTAAHDLARRRIEDVPCRFDVLGLDRGPGGWRFTLVRDAFPFSG
jgi:putative endonuclease